MKYNDLLLIALLFAPLATLHAQPSSEKAGRESKRENWGAYRIVSASAPEFVLEAVGGVEEGAVVSIQKPSGDANQKWIVAAVDDAVRVASATDPSLVLSVEKGNAKSSSTEWEHSRRGRK